MDLIVHDVRLIDTRHPDRDDNTSIEITDGRIQSVGSVRIRGDTRTLDGGGRYVLPGLVNSHDHLYSVELRDPIPGLGLAGMRQWIDRRSPVETLAVMVRNGLKRLREGIAVERDMAANHALNVELARLVEAAVVPGPVIIPAGRPIVMTGGHIYHLGREADGPWQCREAVREQAKVHAGVIKVMCSGGLSRYPDEDFGVPEFTSEEIAAIVDEAHRRGLPAAAHAFHREAVKRAIDGGIDSIEHGVAIDEDDLERMASRGIGYVPTVSNMRRVAEIARTEAEANGDPLDRVEAIDRGVLVPHIETVGRAISLGVKIGLGTDSTGSYQDEIHAMLDAGMDAASVIRAATVDGAEICRADAGVVEPGALGTLLLYESDPRLDPLSLPSPDVIVHRGVPIGNDFWRIWGLG